ncbi:MAG: hypothetical protein Kow00124_25540 [Anaerolineae bacterium]
MSKLLSGPPSALRIAAIVVFLLLIAIFGGQSVLAEGSSDLTEGIPSASLPPLNRPYTEWSGQNTAGIQRRTLVRVYAIAGEEIVVGSSAYDSFNDDGDADPTDGDYDILLRSPGAAPTEWRFNVQNTGPCWINTRAKEVAGPLPAAGGYDDSCKIVAPTTGIYEVEFYGWDFSTADVGNPTAAAATANPLTDDQDQTVAAWDVTVRLETAPGVYTEYEGRTFTNYIAMNMGGTGSALRTELYVLTYDGYIYRVDILNQFPFGFIFFANNRGFLNASTGDPLYQSVALTTADQFQSTDTIHNPNSADTALNVTHKVFFNYPDLANLPASATLPGGGTTWLDTTPPAAPPTPQNFAFTGRDGTPNQAAEGEGGTFTFDNPSGLTGSYNIILDFNDDGVFDAEDRLLQGTALPGANSVDWDGLDGQGNPVQAGGPTPVRVEIRLNYGEVHFPFFDVERNNGGITITRLNGQGAPNSDIYWDDRPIGGGSFLPPTPQDSTGGGHIWTTTAYGDHRGIDTWAFIQSPPIELAGDITVAEADLALAKSHSPAGPFYSGDTVTYTLVVTNAATSPSPVSNATITDTPPAGLTGFSWTCAVTAGTGNCDQAAGTGALNTTFDLNPGGEITYTITATINAGAGTLTNNASVTTGPDVLETNPDNNSASDTITVLASADLEVSKTAAPLTAGVGDSVTFTVTVNNRGPDATTGVVISDAYPAGLSTPPTLAPSQGSAAYDGGTGIITWTVGALASGGSATLDITATLTAGGQITNSAQVTASDVYDPDSTPDNNNPEEDDQASVTLNAAQADLRLSKTISPAVIYVGDTVTYTLTVTNDGPDATTGVAVGDILPVGLAEPPTLTTGQGSAVYDAGTRSITWTVGNLASGASATLQIAAVVTGTGSITNAAEVTASDVFDPDSTPGNTNPQEDDFAAVTFVPLEREQPGPTPGQPGGPVVLDPALSKQVDPLLATVGEPITWTITVTNPHGDTITDVVVSDNLPAMFDLLSVTTTKGFASVSGNSFSVTIGTMAPAEVVTITIRSVANAAALPPQTCNQAIARASVSNQACPSIYPETLPATGGGPVGGWLWLLPVGMMLIAGAAALAVLRVRRPLHR